MCPKNLKDLDIKKILIVGAGSISYNLLMTPAFKKIREIFKDAQIDIMLGSSSREFAEENPWFSGCILYNGNPFRFLKSARRKRYDLVVSFTNPLIPVLLRGKYRLSFFYRYFFSEKKFTHESKRILDLLIPYFGEEKEIKLSFPISKKDRDIMSERLKSLGIKNSDIRIVLNPGAGREERHWDKEKFAEVAKELFNTYGDLKIFITGVESEKQLCEGIKNGINSNSVYNLAGKTSLKELAALLEGMDLVITNDSITMHMASAVNCPIVAIFGPTNPYRYGPIGTKNFVVHSDIDCFPCKNSKRCRRNYLCLKQVTTQQVIKPAMLILDEKEQPLLFDL